MKMVKKTLLLTILIFATLISGVFATPISVSDVNIQETGSNYMALVTLNNENVSEGIYDELSFTIEELGTSKDIGVVTIENTTKTLTYNLNEITDNFDSLKKGSSYRLTVSTSENSITEAFLYGEEKDTEGLDIIIEEVEVNEEEVTDSDVLSVLNGETLKIDLRFSALTKFDDARIMVYIEGYEHSPLVGTTPIFGVKEGKTYIKSLEVELPEDMNNQQDYKLRITGANELSGLLNKDYTLYVDTQRHRVDILDVIMTPSSGVEPGQNIIGNVRLKNRGQKSEDSVKTIIKIPELGISESSYVSNLNSDEVVTSDDMLLFIDEEAQAGEYEVLVELVYDDGYTSSIESFTLNVLSPKIVEEKNLIVSLKDNQELIAGKDNTFNVVVANPNKESKPISISPIETVWSDVEVSPSLAMVKGGESETFTITVTPKDSVVGEKTLNLLVKDGSEKTNEFTVSTYVEGSGKIDWVNVALVVLLIIAIIILLSLIVTITRKKKEDTDDELSSSTEEYY